MTPTTPLSDAELEAELRAMLARRAADVSPAPPALPGDPRRAAARGGALRAARIRRPRHTRALLAAALVLVVGAVAAVALRATDPPTDRTTTGSDDVADADSPSDDQAPSAGPGPRPGDIPAIDALPTPVGPLDDSGVLALYAGRGTAAEVARDYLASRNPSDPDALTLDVARTTEATIPGGGSAVVIPWRPATRAESADDPPIGERYSGTVKLRQVDGGWAVAEAVTDQIAVRDVRRDGATVTVTIDRLDEDAIDLMQIDAFDLTGRPVGDPQFATLGLPGTYDVDLRGADPDEPLTLRIRHVGGTWFSITEVRVPGGGG
jgi:hypothetical protein